MTKTKTRRRPLSKWAREEIARISDEEDRRITEAAISDPDNPPLTDEDFAAMRPTREVVPDLVANPPKIGRPRKDHPKKQITLRLDPDIVEHFRGTGKGWQSRINDALRDAMKNTNRVS